MAKDFTTPKEDALEAENTGLRQMLAQAGIDASQLLAKAGINATEQEAAARLQRLLLEELHHRVKNTLATVMAITSQSLKNATSMEQGREAIAHRLIALGRAHDLLLQTSWTSASLPAVVSAAIGPFDTPGAERFIVQVAEIDVGPAAVLSLALALNELCTNAVKFGALSNTEGHVEITSVLDEKAQRFKLIWAEKGGPAVKAGGLDERADNLVRAGDLLGFFDGSQRRARHGHRPLDLDLLLLLWGVTVTGLLAETCRLVLDPGDPFIASSFVAGRFAAVLRGVDVPWRAVERVMWIVHATAAVTFFACIPFTKFVHVVVAPLGRSLTDGGAYGQLKRARITEGLLSP